MCFLTSTQPCRCAELTVKIVKSNFLPFDPFSSMVLARVPAFRHHPAGRPNRFARTSWLRGNEPMVVGRAGASVWWFHVPQKVGPSVVRVCHPQRYAHELCNPRSGRKSPLLQELLQFLIIAIASRSLGPFHFFNPKSKVVQDCISC